MALPITCSSIGGAKFLGCSVIDFSATAGWGAQSSEVTINLVEDCTTSPPQAFEVPTVGMPVTFVMDKFEFSGLVQAWDAKAGTDGNPIFSVKLISPHPILEHAQVILDHYEGSVPFYNVINAYGFLESLGGNCPNPNKNGTFFGAPAGGFGTANKTDRGIPWYLIKQAVQVLVGGATGQQYNTFCAGLAFRGGNNNPIKYILDLSSLPDANHNYRIAGPVVSLNDLIDQVCQDGGMDYYVTLLPTMLANQWIIKIVTILRQEEPAIGWSVEGYKTTGEIGAFIDSNNVVTKSMGVELRSEVNSAMIIGGKVKQYYQCVDTAGMTPFWGWDAEGNLLQAEHVAADNGVLGWRVTLDCRKINLALNSPLPNFIVVGENELRASLGDFTSFRANVLNPTNKDAGGELTALNDYLKNTVKITDVAVKGHQRQDPRGAIDGKVVAEFEDNSGETNSEGLRDAKGVYNWLKSYTSDFYGKQFLVYFSLESVICQSQDTNTEQEIYSDIVSSDGAWPTSATAMWHGSAASIVDAPDILGIPNPSEPADQFKDESGKVQAMVKFVGKSSELNTQGLNLDDYVIIDEGGEGGFVIWVKATVEDKWVKGTPVVANSANSIRSALVKIAAPLIDGKNDLPANFANRPIDVFVPNGPLQMNPVVEKESEGEAPPQRNNIGGQGESVAALGPAINTSPVGIGVPLQSTTTCYGPWDNVGANPGSVQVEIDDGLVPWEYGGIEFMEAAGSSKVLEMVTHQQQAEHGEITVPGLPQKGLATNINVSDAGGSSSTQTVMIGTTAVPFNTYNFAVAQQSSAVISNISTSIGAGGITTTYTINSFTPVFGRFSRGNADRLKQIGLNRLKGERELRARRALQNLLRASENRNLANIVAEDKGDDLAPKSPAIWFAGKLDASDTKRKIVLAPTKMTMPYYNEREGAKTSVMTMDGFFRPVQTAEGDAANLPKVVDNYADCGIDPSYQSSGPPPPVTGQEPLKISAQYLDFLADKAKRTGLFDDGRTEGSRDSEDNPLGHDIEGVARGTTADDMWSGDAPGRLIMHTGVGDDEAHDFFDNYRFMALRGPLVVHGWGYDLHGKPIPNKEGDDSNSFTSSYTSLKDEFATDWLEDATTWPVAPVDLRFDRKRGVWTVPSAFRLYQVELSGNISAGAIGHATVIKYKNDILTSGGDVISDPKIKIENWTEATMESGTKALAYYDTAECKYWIIPPASGTSGSFNIGATGCGNDIECSELNDGCLIFGSGLDGVWDGDEPNRGNFTVSGPKIGGNTGCEAVDGSVGMPTMESVPFAELTIGSGLQLTSGSDCSFTLDSCVTSSMNIGYSGCDVGAHVECDTFTGCLVFGSGLAQPVKTDDTFIIQGAQIDSNDESVEHDPDIAGFFDTLTIGSGLQLKRTDYQQLNCAYTIEASGGCDGVTTGLDLVTKVCCSGSNFEVHRKTFEFENGCLMEVNTPASASQHCEDESE